MQTGYVRARAVLVALSVAALATACGGGGGESNSQPSSPQNGDPGTPSTQNHAPTISGTPTGSVQVGQAYQFKPTASDADGDALTYSVQNLPAWLSFDSTTGTLSGTPTAGNVGSFSAIQITVSDGKASATLTAFAVSVVSGPSTATGSATLNWTPPTENADGSALVDPAGYKVLYGRSASALDQSIVINTPGLSSWTVENLAAGTWYFAIVTVNAAGAESLPSNVASIQI